MNFVRMRSALAGAALLPLFALPALAGGGSDDPSAFALPSFAQPSGPMALEALPVFIPSSSHAAEVHAYAIPQPQVARVRYRYGHPEDGPRHSSGPPSSLQIHMGFFDPDGAPARNFLVGVRGGPMLDPHIQIGGGIDWAHDSDHETTIATRTTGPGGTPITVQRDLARSSTDLVPIMAFLQVSAGDALGIVPYFGGSAGYEVMNLSADDFQTGQSFNATYGGWGWQVWGGAALPLSGHTRLKAELFANSAELGRDITDPLYADSYRETVKANGVGARFGLSWGF